MTARLLECHGMLDPPTLDSNRCLELLEVARQASQYAGQVEVCCDLDAALRLSSTLVWHGRAITAKAGRIAGVLGHMTRVNLASCTWPSNRQFQCSGWWKTMRRKAEPPQTCGVSSLRRKRAQSSHDFRARLTTPFMRM